ncbi:MAG: NrfD/PsrC family molybdoenzyme membrane anchor subunit [Acidilobaceae archaeon]
MGESKVPGRLTAFIASLVLIIVGFAMIVYGFTRKEAHIINWGLLNVGYIYFAMAAGGSILIWSIYIVLGYRGPKGELDNIVKLGLWFSIVSLAVAGIVILVKLTRPLDAALLILSSFNPASRIALDVPLITLFIVILAVQLILLIRAHSMSIGRVELALAVLGFIIAIALYSNLAQVHSTLISIPGWYGSLPLLAPYFIASAILLGTASQALFTIPYIWRSEEIKGFMTRYHGSIIALAILVVAFLTIWNIVTVVYRPDAWVTYSEIIMGAYAPIFWIFGILLGIGATLVLALYAVSSRSITALILASILTLIAVFVNIYIITIVHQTIIPEAISGLFIVREFNITLDEVLILIGAIIIWISLYVLGQILLPLLPGEKPRRLLIFK